MHPKADIFAEGDTTGGSSDSEEDMSVEVVSPLRHRPVTRSVSAKWPADEMVDSDDPLPLPLPHPRKVQRIETPGMFQLLGH